MSNPPLNLSPADFDPLPDQPSRTARYWLGNALSLPLWVAVAVTYALID